MLVVGLTGGIASGKSTISQVFKEAGVPVICTDELARLAVMPDTPALDELRRVFGEEFLDSQGNLNREAMARAVFSDEENRKRLESIVHPRVASEASKRMREFRRQGYRIVVMDVPLLYEVGWDRICDCVVVVYAPREIQAERLILRDGISVEDARRRLDAQMSIEEKKERARFVIDNSGTVEESRSQALSILRQLENMAMKEEGYQEDGAGSERSWPAES